jgi:hypothetical protein
MTNTQSKRGKGLRPLHRLLLAGAIALPLAGCDTDKLVEVRDTSQLRPEDITALGAEAVPALVNGAFRQFGGGYSGFGLDDAFLAMSGAISDELYYGDTFITRQAADTRILQPPVLGNISDAPFIRLMNARLNARRGFAVVDQFTSPLTAAQDAVTKSQLRTIEAYVYVTLSEGWCGDVPISRTADAGAIDPFAVEYSAGINTAQLNDTAVARFNEALTLNANAANSVNRLASVGKARALLNNGRYAEAALAVAAVPTGFVYRIEHSVNSGNENNPMFQLMGNGRYGISDLEGGTTATGTALRVDSSTALTAPSAEGLPFRGLRDPRVPFQAKPNCFTTSLRCWIYLNYPSNDSDVPLASGVEARLIEAEAALQAGTPDVMMSKLNALRASSASILAAGALYSDRCTGATPAASGCSNLTLDPLTDPATGTMTPAEQFAARRALLFRERALWLYNTGHRQGDLRRLVRNYGLAPNSVFPSGPFFRGGSYGTDVAYPIPFNEQNNPQFDPTKCVTTQA